MIAAKINAVLNIFGPIKFIQFLVEAKKMKKRRSNKEFVAKFKIPVKVRDI